MRHIIWPNCNGRGYLQIDIAATRSCPTCDGKGEVFECRHEDGYYFNVRFLGLFKREMFFCTGCTRAIPAMKAKQPMYMI